MDTFFKKIGDDITETANKISVDLAVQQELDRSLEEIEKQAREEVIISEKDPGLELADAGKRPAEMLTEKEIREHNLKTIKLDNELDKAFNERNLERGNIPTKTPENGTKKGAYGKRRRKRKYGSIEKKKKKKAGKKKKKTSKKKKKPNLIKDVTKTAENVGREDENVGREDENVGREDENVGREAKKAVKNVGRGAKKAGKKKKKTGKKKKKPNLIKDVTKTAENVGREAENVGRGAKKAVKNVGRGAKKVFKRVGKGVDKIAKGIKYILPQKRSFGRSATPIPMYLEDYEKVQGYDPLAIAMQSLFGKRKKKFGCSTCGCSNKFGKRKRSGYRFGAGCHGKEKFSPKCIGQCSECGSSITGFDPMAIVQKKLSYGKRRRKRKFGDNCHRDHKKFGKRRKKFGGCGGSCGFGKKVSKKPSAATRRMCKRLKVKMTLKRGGKRVYKSEAMLKKQCKTAMKKKSKKKTVKRRKRKSSFGKMTKQEINAITLQNIDGPKLKELKDYARTGEQYSRDIQKLAGLSVVGTGIGLGYQGYKKYKAAKRKKKRKVKRRKRKSSFGKKAKKPSAALRRLCNKHKVRLTVKRGKKRVYKSEAMLKKQCKTAMKKKKKKTVKRKSRCGHAFGSKRKGKGSKKLTNFQKFNEWCNNNEVACTAALTPLAVGIPMGMSHVYNKYYVEPYNSKQQMEHFKRLQRNANNSMGMY